MAEAVGLEEVAVEVAEAVGLREVEFEVVETVDLGGVKFVLDSAGEDELFTTVIFTSPAISPDPRSRFGGRKVDNNILPDGRFDPSASCWPTNERFTRILALRIQFCCASGRSFFQSKYSQNFDMYRGLSSERLPVVSG